MLNLAICLAFIAALVLPATLAALFAQRAFKGRDRLRSLIYGAAFGISVFLIVLLAFSVDPRARQYDFGYGLAVAFGSGGVAFLFSALYSLVVIDVQRGKSGH